MIINGKTYEAGELIAYVENLEKENAELKEKIEHRNCVDCSNHHSNIKLLKAKEIIKELYEGLDKLYLSGLSDKQIAFVERLQDKTEQFLKEFE